MATLHIVHKADNITVIVNGTNEITAPDDEYITVLSFLDSLVEMMVITEGQHPAACDRVLRLVGLE